MESFRKFSQRRIKPAVEEVASIAAEEVANIEDLLIEILQRLPTKIVIRFKIVSKQWLSLISSFHFSISHTRSLEKEGLLEPSAIFFDVIYRQPITKFMHLPLYLGRKQIPLFDFVNAPYLKIMQSCTGLLLCISDYGNPSYFICNPVIRKCKTVSFPRPPAMDYQLVGVNLAFDPLISPYYKIISVWQEVFPEKDEEGNCLRYMSSMFSIDIYSSKTGSWSISKQKFASDFDIKFDHAVFFNDAIHWDSADSESLYFEVESECLMSMPMPMPKPSRRYNGYRYFGESGGHLHVVVGRRPVDCLKFRIFEMLDDYSDWFFKYRLDLLAEIMQFPYAAPPINEYDLLWFTFFSDGDGGDSLVTIFENGLKLCYDFEHEALIELTSGCPRVENYQHDYDNFRGCQYFETLSFV